MTRPALPRIPLTDAERRVAANPEDREALEALRGWRNQLTDAGTDVSAWEAAKCPGCGEWLATEDPAEIHEHITSFCRYSMVAMRYRHELCGIDYSSEEAALSCVKCGLPPMQVATELIPASQLAGEQVLSL